MRQEDTLYDYIKSVAVSPDGKYVVSGTSDGSTLLWDLENDNEPILTLNDNWRDRRLIDVWTVTETADGNQIISGSDENVLKLWDVKSGDLIRTFEGHTGSVYDIVLTPAGKHAITCSGDQTIRL